MDYQKKQKERKNLWCIISGNSFIFQCLRQMEEEKLTFSKEKQFFEYDMWCGHDDEL